MFILIMTKQEVKLSQGSAWAAGTETIEIITPSWSGHWLNNSISVGPEHTLRPMRARVGHNDGPTISIVSRPR